MVSYPSGYRLRLAQYEAWQEQAAGRAVFVGAVPDWQVSLSEGQRFFPDLGGAAACRHLTGYLQRQEEEPAPPGEAVEVKLRGAEQVGFNTERGVIVNYNFSPRWRSSRPRQTVFVTAPSQIFVFGQGRNMLEYGR